MNITLKDGSVKSYEAPVSAADVCKDLSMGLYRAACSCRINGEVKDLRTVIDGDSTLEILTFDDEDGKKTFWHTASHLLAQAVKRLFPGAKLAIGPAIDSGFYYDFDVEKPFTPEDLAALEAEMKKIVKEKPAIERFTLSPADARKLMEDRGEPYKIELIEEHAAKGDDISFYSQGEFTDLCAGPHLMDISIVKAFKLTATTGAYWRGNSKNRQLCRVYGVAFPKAAQLEEHLTMLEEAKKRDHKVIGRQLEYFTTVDVIGQGLPILLPKGAKVIQLLQRWVEDTEDNEWGYLRTKTPYMAKRELYKISGHWDHYLDGMFVMGDPNDETKECFALRPMTCPFQYQVFLNRARSYRDLPMRLGETSTLFRNEDSGEMHGLIRVRQFTISEGHRILRPEQLEDEFRDCLKLAKHMLECLGLAEDVTYRFSQWDPKNPGNKYEGTAEQWEIAQSTMQKILDHIGLTYSVGIDEAAFYGPKLDIQIKNVHGKEDTLITIQIDMLLAQKFGMEYVDSDGQKKTPYIIHRTSMGCYERTLALLLEKYAGALPVWIAPEQVRILPVTDRAHDYSAQLRKTLKAAGLRAEVDTRSEKIGYKIREAQMEKVPFMLVIGDKEVENSTVAVRSRAAGDLGSMTVEEFLSLIRQKIETYAAD